MCQTGAVGMAEVGKKYREILRHYYPNTVLRKVW
jgi:SpoIID/LytB domain protein